MSLTVTGAYREAGAVLILIAGQEHSLPIKINAGSDLQTVTFSANGEHLLSGGRDQNVQVWRVQDGQRVATIKVKNVLCLAVSKNGKWTAGGTLWGDVFVWDAETYDTVWKLKVDYDGDIRVTENIYTIDFSSDSTKLVSGTSNYTATIWDVTSGEKIRTLQHKQGLIAAKFSSDSDRIATTTNYSVQVWDSKDGHLLVDIPGPLTVTSWYNNGLLWFNNHIFIVSGSTIKQLDASTGSTVYEWPVPNSDFNSCIAIPRHGKFIACSTSRSLTFWDMSTHLQIDLVEYTEDICSIELSSDNRCLAIGGCYGTIIIKGLSYIIVSA